MVKEEDISRICGEMRFDIKEDNYFSITRDGTLLCRVYPSRRYVEWDFDLVEEASISPNLEKLIEVFGLLGYKSNSK